MTSSKVPTNDQIIREAQRRWEVAPNEQKWRLEHYVIEVVLEGWTPPEPVDPDVLAFREWWASGESTSDAKRAFLAGARMAREQERERAKVLLEFAEDIAKFSLNYGVRANRALAKYRGEA